MDINKYTSFFHDGSIFKIDHKENFITIYMQSAEMHEEDIVDDLILTKKDRIRGNLHIEGVKKVINNHKEILEKIGMKFPKAEILDFDLYENKVELQILWNTIPMGDRSNDFSALEITADKIWWENLPDSEEI
jgi:hypothetical protein